MLTDVLAKRLSYIEQTIVRFIPPDADIVGFVVADENGRFALEVSMQDSVDMAQRYRDILSAALTDEKVEYVYTERGRRKEDPTGQYIFTTKDFVITAVNFSQWATLLGETTEGPKDSEDPEIEKFIADQEQGTSTDV